MESTFDDLQSAGKSEHGSLENVDAKTHDILDEYADILGEKERADEIGVNEDELEDDLGSFLSDGERSSAFNSYFDTSRKKDNEFDPAVNCDVSKLESIFENEDSSPEEARFAYYQLCLLLERNPALSPEECRFAYYYTNSIPKVTALHGIKHEDGGQLTRQERVDAPEASLVECGVDYKYLLLLSRNTMSASRSFRVALILSVLSALAEPVIVAFGNTFLIFYIQVGILGLSTVIALYVQYLSVVHFDMAHYNSEMTKPNVTKRPRAFAFNFGFYKQIHGDEMEEVKYVPLSLYELLAAVTDEMTAFEYAFIAFGWLTLFLYYDIAALRCVRPLRLLWYFAYFPSMPSSEIGIVGKFGSVLVGVGRFYLKYVKRLTVEILPALLRGFLVLTVYFFVTYIFSVVYWNLESSLDVPNHDHACEDLRNCFITLLRLSLLEEQGLEFLTATMNADSPGMVVGLIMFLCLTSVVLWSGLIGIFAVAFARDHVDQEYQKNKDEERKIFEDNLSFFKEEIEKLHKLENRVNSVLLKLNGVASNVVALRNETRSKQTTEPWL